MQTSLCYRNPERVLNRFILPQRLRFLQRRVKENFVRIPRHIPPLLSLRLSHPALRALLLISVLQNAPLPPPTTNTFPHQNSYTPNPSGNAPPAVTPPNVVPSAKNRDTIVERAPPRVAPIAAAFRRVIGRTPALDSAKSSIDKLEPSS